MSTTVEPATSPRSHLGTPKSLRQRRGRKSSEEASAGSSISLVDVEISEPSTLENVNITDEGVEKEKTCLDSLREFGASCRVYFDEIACSMIAYFNEISEDYRIISKRLEEEWTDKCRENLKSAQERHESMDLAESSTSADGINLGKQAKVAFYIGLRH